MIRNHDDARVTVVTSPLSDATLMSDYDFRPGGSLKLKGVSSGGVTKKKKKSDKTKSKTEKAVEHDRVREAILNEDTEGASSSSASEGHRNSPSTSGGIKTEAERRFEEVQRRRLAERVKKLADKTHKDRVHEFNTKLEALSEHHDIPKVGPG